MKAYIIKGTYTEKGRSFFLDNMGYVMDNINLMRSHECYKTEKAAKMVATKKTKANAEQAAYYDRCNEERIKNGKEPFNYCYDRCIYEAYEIEVEK